MLRALVRAVLDRVSVRIAARIGTQATLLLTGKLCAARVRELPDATALSDTEFKVFSQWGEDGIIQFLISRVATPSRTFVEFGTQDYTESNTRFLLVNDNWRGLVIDGSERDIGFIRADAISWRHDLEAVCAFVTRDNINELIARRFAGEELGLLSIDIDGNDYWIWQAIEVRPSIVVCEYNSVFGSRLAVTVPYRADFDRTAAHFSNLYFGASLPALCRLAQHKGYAFVGSNSAGSNAFFVRGDRLGALRALGAQQGYVESRLRESQDAQGRLTYLAGIERLRAIRELPLVDLASGAARPISELFSDELQAAR